MNFVTFSPLYMVNRQRNEKKTGEKNTTNCKSKIRKKNSIRRNLFSLSAVYARPPARSLGRSILNSIFIHFSRGEYEKKSIEMMCSICIKKNYNNGRKAREKMFRFLHNVSSIVMMWINSDTFQYLFSCIWIRAPHQPPTTTFYANLIWVYMSDKLSLKI